MPEVPQATLDALLAKLASLQEQVTAVSAEVMKMSLSQPKVPVPCSDVDMDEAPNAAKRCKMQDELCTSVNKYQFMKKYEQGLIPVQDPKFTHVLFVPKMDPTLFILYHSEVVQRFSMTAFPDTLLGVRVEGTSEVVFIEAYSLLAKPEVREKWHSVLPQAAVQWKKLGGTYGSARSITRFMQCLLPSAALYRTETTSSALTHTLTDNVKCFSSEVKCQLVEALHEFIEAEPALKWNYYFSKMCNKNKLEIYDEQEYKVDCVVDVSYITDHFVRLYHKSDPQGIFDLTLPPVNYYLLDKEITGLYKPGSKTYARWLQLKEAREKAARKQPLLYEELQEKLQLLKPYVGCVHMFDGISVQDDTFRAVAVCKPDHSALGLNDTTNKHSEYKAVCVYGIKHDDHVVLFDHSKPTDEWRNALYQAACRLPKIGGVPLKHGECTWSMIHTLQVCLLPLATLVTPQGVVKPIVSLDYKELIIAMHQMAQLKQDKCSKEAWNDLSIFRDRYLGNGVTAVEFPWKEEAISCFLSLYPHDLGLMIYLSGKLTRNDYEIRAKYKNTIVEIRLDTLVLEEVEEMEKKSACRYQGKLNKLSCYPQHLTKAHHPEGINCKGGLFVQFFKNSAGQTNLYYLNFHNVYEVVDVLGVRLGHQPVRNLATLVDRLLAELTTLWDTLDIEDKLDKVLAMLKVFAVYYKDGKIQPTPRESPNAEAPTMCKETRELFLAMLNRLIVTATTERSDVSQHSDVWQRFINKLLNEHTEKTLGGVEYTYVYYDIRFLLTKFVSLYNGKVFSVREALPDASMKGKHSRDNWKTLVSLGAAA